MALEPIKESVKLKQLIADIEETMHISNQDMATEQAYSILTDVPIEILEDNRACIDWSEHRTNSTKMRHLERSLKWIQTYLAEDKIRLIHIPAENQLTNIFTKPLAKTPFLHLRDRFLFNFAYPSRRSLSIRFLFHLSTKVSQARRSVAKFGAQRNIKFTDRNCRENLENFMEVRKYFYLKGDKSDLVFC
jgi:hypothetical protein